MKKIKHVSELPEWFKLENYEGAKNFNLADWCEQLQGRTLFINAYVSIFCTTDENSKEYELRKSAAHHKILEHMRQNPLNIYKDNILRAFLSEIEPEISPFTPSSYLGVKEMTARNYLFISDELKPAYLATLQAIMSGKTALELPEWIDAPLNQLTSDKPQDYDVVLIDLHVPDNLLLEHFKTYLKMKRVENRTKESHVRCFSKSDKESWHRFGVLPYIDLRIWSLENRALIPYRVLADAIFPSGSCGEETIRKTTAPLAEQLTSDEYLKYLAAQATQEYLEQNVG